MFKQARSVNFLISGAFALLLSPVAIADEAVTVSAPTCATLLEDKKASELNILFDGKKSIARANEFFLETLSVDPLDRQHQHVDDFVELIPGLIGFLDKIDASKFSEEFSLHEEYDSRIPVNIKTIGQAIEFLKTAARNAVEQNSVSMNWFTFFALDVLVLTSIDEMSDMAIITNVAGLGDSIEEALNEGIILWPTFAQLDQSDFKFWHRGIAPIGLSLGSDLSYDGLVNQSRLDFYVHDLEHAAVFVNEEASSGFPVKLFPNKGQSSQVFLDKFAESFFAQLDQIDNFSERTILEIVWFEVAHEDSDLLKLLVNASYDKESSTFVYDEALEDLFPEDRTGNLLEHLSDSTRYADSMDPSFLSLPAFDKVELLHRLRIQFASLVKDAFGVAHSSTPVVLEIDNSDDDFGY